MSKEKKKKSFADTDGISPSHWTKTFYWLKHIWKQMEENEGNQLRYQMKWNVKFSRVDIFFFLNPSFTILKMFLIQICSSN